MVHPARPGALPASVLLLMLVTTPLVQAEASEHVSYAYADVLRVDPVYETIRHIEPREECSDQAVSVRKVTRGNGGGAIIGAIIGGVLGSQVGSGDGRRAATAAGAVLGGAIGNDAERRMEGEQEYETVEQRCRIVEVEREERRIAGYDVEYRLKGEVYFSRLSYDPGNKLRVRVSVTPVD